MPTPRSIAPPEFRTVDDAVENLARAIHREAGRFFSQAFPKLLAGALAMQAAGLSSELVPQLFAQDLVEIPPTLNEDLLDLYGRSQQVLAGRFAFLNHTEELGEQFDWEQNASSAWRRELHSFDFGLDLALTYRISREERYAGQLRYLIAHWIAENPPGLGTGWEELPLSRRIRNWILCADLARDAWSEDFDFQAVFSHSLALQTVFLARLAGSGRSLEVQAHFARALLLAGRFFSGRRAAELRETACEVVNSAGEFDPSHHLSPVEALTLAEALVDFLLFAPDEAESLRSHLTGQTQRVLAALESALLPDGTLPVIGPGATSAAGPLTDLFAIGAVLFDKASWKRCAGGFGILPYMLLGERGKSRFAEISERERQPIGSAISWLGLARLDGSANSTLIVVAASSAAKGAHLDFGSYSLGIQGQRVIVDSGGFFPQGGTQDAYFPSALAHNVLLVDGFLQMPAHNGHSDWISETTKGDEIVSTLRIAPTVSSDGKIKIRRTFFCLEGRAWVVVDFASGEGTPHLRELIHFYPTFDAQLQEGRVLVRSRALNLVVIPLGFTNPKIRFSRGEDKELPGFYSPELGVKFDSITLSMENPSARLPWLGGYLIVPEALAGFVSCAVSCGSGTISFQISGKAFRLSV